MDQRNLAPTFILGMQEIGIENSLVTCDAFSRHLIDVTQETNGLEVEYYGFRYHIWALRLTFPYSPFFDLSEKYPLRSRLTKIAMKTILRKCWVKYVSSTAEIFP